jgi:hypothetical protein
VEAEIEVRGSFEDLSDVGRLVYLAFMKTQDDVVALADELLKEGRRTAEEAILQAAQAIGCGVVSVHLTAGELLSWIRERADWAAQKICDTYNRDLVNAILRIIEETPTANRWVIAHRLQEWEARRQEWKSSQIAITEAFVVSNEAKMRFYEMNKVTEPEAWFGYSLQCEVCQEIARRNPYTLAEAEAIGLPHPNCLDQWHIRGGEMVDCNELWLGE